MPDPRSRLGFGDGIGMPRRGRTREGRNRSQLREGIDGVDLSASFQSHGVGRRALRREAVQSARKHVSCRPVEPPVIGREQTATRQRHTTDPLRDGRRGCIPLTADVPRFPSPVRDLTATFRRCSRRVNDRRAKRPRSSEEDYPEITESDFAASDGTGRLTHARLDEDGFHHVRTPTTSPAQYPRPLRGVRGPSATRSGPYPERRRQAHGE